MLTPIRNGVVVYSHEYGAYFKADVYVLKGYGFAFRVNNNRFWDSEEEDFKVGVIDSWWDEDRTFGTMLVPFERVTCSDEFQQYLPNQPLTEEEEKAWAEYMDIWSPNDVVGMVDGWVSDDDKRLMLQEYEKQKEEADQEEKEHATSTP